MQGLAVVDRTPRSVEKIICWIQNGPKMQFFGPKSFLFVEDPHLSWTWSKKGPKNSGRGNPPTFGQGPKENIFLLPISSLLKGKVQKMKHFGAGWVCQKIPDVHFLERWVGSIRKINHFLWFMNLAFCKPSSLPL